MFKKLLGLSLALMMILILAACSASGETEETTAETTAATQAVHETETVQAETKAQTNSDFNAVITTANVTSTGVIDATDLFTERDLTQNADLSGASEPIIAVTTE